MKNVDLSWRKEKAHGHDGTKRAPAGWFEVTHWCDRCSRAARIARSTPGLPPGWHQTANGRTYCEQARCREMI